MQLTNLALLLATVISSVAAYPIKADSVNCRSGPGTSYSVVRTYAKGHDVKLTCQARGESVNGDSLWDKTTDGCYVADYYVKTGTSGFVTGECGSSGGGSSGGGSSGGGSSSYNGKITRKEILARANYWISRHIPYSMSKTYPDPQGRKYRTDMALHTNSPGFNTVSLPSIATAISWSALKPGNFVGTLGAGTGGAAGHVTLFLSWADSKHTAYNTLECRGSAGCVQYKRNIGWKVGSYTAKPYRYIRVVD
ncbi:hypothetical protein C8A05DRAFT_17191 [Staphylotrichum tortipilum]|uniref:SH3b domain-containing protein n=1 Tax=Staphylotrichum tortipilum TaxID=2831512 RepID=A0AAN6MGN2_9PEZI|nr:hypothetical protein C8A05DRAFT_17191 [Staphylotrichum longicolle]